MDQGPPQNNDSIVRLIEEHIRSGTPLQRFSIVSPSIFLNSNLLNRSELVNLVTESLEENKDPPKPMCKNFIESLKQTTIINDDDLSCAICQDKFKEGETVIELPCKGGKHLFHFEEGECPGLKPWIEINNTCPVCRYEFPLEPEPEPEPESEPESEPEPESESEGITERRIVLAENIMEQTFTNLVRGYIDRAFEELEDRELNEAIQRSLDDS